MRREKVATVKVFERNKKTVLYLFRGEDWTYKLEDTAGKVIKVFDIEEVEVPPENVPDFRSGVEAYLNQFKDELFPTPCLIFYEIEYKHVGNIDYEVGFKPLKEWYQRYLTYLTQEIFEVLKEDFVAGSWQMFMRHYNENREYRRLLGIERSILRRFFGNVLGFVKYCLDDDKRKEEFIKRVYNKSPRNWLLDLVENLYGKPFRDWLAETIEKINIV
jgi:hypothetical protein